MHDDASNAPQPIPPCPSFHDAWPSASPMRSGTRSYPQGHRWLARLCRASPLPTLSILSFGGGWFQLREPSPLPLLSAWDLVPNPL